MSRSKQIEHIREILIGYLSNLMSMLQHMHTWWTDTMSPLSSLSRRLAKVEQKLADSARREKLVNCICGDTIIAVSTAPEQFEAEMNRTCPVHGFRRLEKIIPVIFGRVDASDEPETDGPDTDEVDKDQAKNQAKLLQLLETYELRFWKDCMSRVELEGHES
jgi:hypothetical protein